MAVDLNTKPWYLAAIVGLVLGVALFAVMHMYVFKDIQAHIERLEANISDLEREIEKGRAAKADLPRLEEDIRTSPEGHKSASLVSDDIGALTHAKTVHVKNTEGVDEQISSFSSISLAWYLRRAPTGPSEAQIDAYLDTLRVRKRIHVSLTVELIKNETWLGWE